MTTISFASAEVPHVEMFCRHLPSEPARSGNFVFHIAQMYDVTPETLIGLHEQLTNWGPKFSDVIRITEHGAVVVPQAEVATIEVATVPPIETTVPKESEAEVVATPTELTDLELEEIQVAVNLLDNKTIAQATPILEATFADESKSLLWRQTYVEYASTEEKLPKGLRTAASDLYLASL